MNCNHRLMCRRRGPTAITGAVVSHDGVA